MPEYVSYCINLVYLLDYVVMSAVGGLRVGISNAKQGMVCL